MGIIFQRIRFAKFGHDAIDANALVGSAAELFIPALVVQQYRQA